MKQVYLAFAVGLLMALGLGLSGMTQPAKIIGFLDFAGAWDPSLMLVMAGAIGVHFVAYRLVARRPGPFFAEKFQIPTFKKIDARLLGGAALFGIGWGLSGFCPGPAITALVTGTTEVLLFVPAMLAGQFLFFLVGGKGPSA